MFGQSYGRFHRSSAHHPTMRSFHHQQRNIFKTSCRAPIHFSSSSLLSLGFLSLLIHRAIHIVRSHPPTSSTSSTPAVFLRFSCDFFAFVLSEINDARIRNPPWHLDEETRRRWWAGAPWRLRLGECVPLF